MTHEERCLLITDIMRYMNRMFEMNSVIGSNVWFDLAFCLIPAIAMGKPTCFSPRMKVVRLLRMNAALWSQVSEFLIVTEAADAWFERKRMLDSTNTDLTVYLKRLADTGVPCGD